MIGKAAGSLGRFLRLTALLLLFAAGLPLVLIFSLVIKRILLSGFHKGKGRILVLPAFFPSNAGTHWRVKTWVDILREEGYVVKMVFLWDQKGFEKFMRRRSPFLGFSFAIKRAFQIIFNSFRFDAIWVRREAVPQFDLGWNFTEKLIKLLYSKRILDFDDDLAASKGEPLQVSTTGRFLGLGARPFTAKSEYYNYFTIGNNHLKRWLYEVGHVSNESPVLVLPTCYSVMPDKVKDYTNPHTDEKIVIGWVGNTNNFYHLDAVVHRLNEFSEVYSMKLLVVSGLEYSHMEARFEIENRPWSLDTERNDIFDFDIGIMPLAGRRHEAGKSAFKLIQYMAHGLITLSTPIGANAGVIQHGVNGFSSALDHSDWSGLLERMVHMSVADKRHMSAAALNTIREGYTFESNRRGLINFLNRAIQDKSPS